MRNLELVRSAILNSIPDDGIKEAVDDATSHIIDSLPYTAPELLTERWMEFSYELRNCLARHEETEWYPTTLGIFQDTVNYEDYLR